MSSAKEVKMTSFSSSASEDRNLKCLSDLETPIQQTTSFSIGCLSSDTRRSISEEPAPTWIGKLCPPRGWSAKWFTWFIILAAAFGAIWSVYPNRMLPQNGLFGVVITILLCLAAEQLVIKVPTPKGLPPIPPLFASLLMGLALRNIPYINVAAYIDEKVGSDLRELSLTVILTRAGLEIEPEAMKKVKWAVVRLAFTPCIIETTLIGVLGHYILGFPFEWSFMTGFMIAAVSPAVVIPSLIILQSAGYGVAKGVPSLVMAASGIDDVLAIAGFTILLGIAIPGKVSDDIVNYFWRISHGDITSTKHNIIAFPAGNKNFSMATHVENYNDPDFTKTQTHATENYPSAPPIGKDIGSAIVQVIIGVVSGLVLGLFISYFPSKNMKYKSFCRGFLLLSIGILFVFGSDVWGIPGAGSLCALIMSFTASFHWQKETEPLAQAWEYMWVVFQPILFGLTGALVDVSIMDGKTVGLGLAVLFIALIGRLMTSTAVTFGLNFNLKEKLFVSVAWIPKGTVQAALGSAALDQALEFNRPDQEVRWGQEILVLAVLITLITAPIGGFGIALSGPRLLTTSMEEPELENHKSETDSKLSRDSSDSQLSSSINVDGVQIEIKDSALSRIEESKQTWQDNEIEIF